MKAALPNRRHALVEKVRHEGHTFFIACDFDRFVRVREVHAFGKRENADALLMLAENCELISGLLQRGMGLACVRRLIGRGGESHSLIGALVEAARRIQAEHGRPAARAWRQWGIA